MPESVNLVSSESVIAKLYRDLKPADASWQLDAIEWMGEALDFIGYGAALLTKTIQITLVSHRAQLPADFAQIVSINLNGSRILPNLDSRQNAEEGGYFISGADTKTLVCESESGVLDLFYYAYPVDSQGYPLIPNTPYYKQALWWYVVRQMMLSGYQNPLFDYPYSDDQWKRYCRSAQNDLMMPSVDRVEATMQQWARLLPDRLRWQRNFGSGPIHTTGGPGNGGPIDGLILPKYYNMVPVGDLAEQYNQETGSGDQAGSSTSPPDLAALFLQLTNG